MLGRFTIARFALSNDSPTRERREILFAKDKDDDREKGNIRETEGKGSGRQDQENITKGLREGASAVIPEVMIPDMEMVYDSPEAAEYADFDEENAVRKKLPAREQELATGGRWRSELPHDRRDTIEETLQAERRSHVQEYLKDPAGTLHLAKELRSRAERVDGFTRGLDAKIQALFRPSTAQSGGLTRFFVNKIRGLLGSTKSPSIGMNSRKLALLFMESSMTPEHLEELTLDIPGQEAKEEIKEILRRDRVDRYSIETIIDHDGDLQNALRSPGAPSKDDLIRLVIDAQSFMRKEQTAGLYHEKEGTDPVERWKKYLQNLTTQTIATEKFLDEQLQMKSSANERKLSDAFNDAQRQCFNNETQTGDELDTEFLKRFGVTHAAAKEAYFERTTNLHRIQRKPVGEASATKMRKPGQSDYQKYADDSLRELSEMESELETEDGFLAEERAEQEELERWAYQTGNLLREFQSRRNDPVFEEQVRAAVGDAGIDFYEQLHDRLDPYVDADGDPEELEKLRLNPELCVTTTTSFDVKDSETGQERWTLTRQRRDRISATLCAVIQNPESLQSDMDALSKHTKRNLTPAETRAEVERIRSRVREIGEKLFQNGELCDGLRHDVCEMLGVPKALRERMNEIESGLATVGAKKTLITNTGQELAIQERKLEQLDQCAALSGAIRVQEVSVQEMQRMGVPTEKDGWYEYGTGIIYIRNNLDPKQRQEVEQHERGHAIVDILTRRTKTFPFLMNSFHRELQSKCQEDEDGNTFDELLRSMAEPWGIAYQHNRIVKRFREKYPDDPARADDEAEREYTHMLMDELVNQYAQWKNLDQKKREVEPKTEEKKRERRLFKMLEEGMGRRNKEGYRVSLEDDDPALRVFTRASEGEDIVAAVAAEEAPADVGEGGDIKDDLHDIQKGIKKVEDFHEAYDEIPIKPDGLIKNLNAGYQRLNDIFIRKDSQYPPSPEENANVKKAIAYLKKSVENVTKQIDEIDAKKLDTTKEQRDPGGFFSRMRFMSIMDIVKLWNDTKEDIKHIYKRRQDRTLKDVGDPILRALKAGKAIPLAGHYLDELHQYHERKYAGEEVKAANEWKEGLANEDSNTILRMIHGSHNKDQVRGIIALLCDRGEMDWNDEGTWDTLAHLSGYHHVFPKTACRRSDILRDTWLRIMIAAIWKDKELYYQFRQTNDSKIESGKKSFEAKVDQLSNVRGGMAAELELQLEIWVEWNKEKRGKLPDAVKPHLYEEVISYAIEKGKMTMEQKMYYLVQGVATNLLSIDRLRVLAGKYLNQFPFIDYFYGRNNTLPEVKALAHRLRETAPGNKFKPGIRTTLWLHYEVAREKGAQERLSKALSGARAEGIDHEDVPFFITNVDVSSVDNMTGVISGTRAKVSPEGAKNAYVGWNSKFKSFGALMEAEEKGYERVSAGDIDMLAQTLTGYIRYDNIITRNVTNLFADTERLVLTDNQFNSVPVSGVTTTKNYRQGMTGFLREIVRELRPHIQENLNRDPLIRPIGGNPVQVEDFIQTDPEGPLRHNNQDKAKELYSYTKNFDIALTKAIREHAGTFKEILRAYSQREEGPRFHNEGGSKDFNVQDAVGIIKERYEKTRADA
ncbi:hypothetical protein HY285_05240 [Candidatus Peregrinibacteria bacterium]|nr:hypothetical protein [Candidatus Peregrinibacteria bacterium]MBI3816916.1 hypothetical protein [Candidatus Peregrinibacteria bacterium]